MDWVSGFWNHPFDGAIVAPPLIFLIAASFSPQFSGTLAIIQIVTGLFLHANVRWRWRPLHRLVITPEFHHWHHANERDAINSNYSVFLPLWDIIFGTYYMPKDKRPRRYGISEPMPDGIVAQLKHPLRGMGNPLRVVAHPIRSTKGGAFFIRCVLRDIAKSTLRRRRFRTI
jgi:sterol desaturase/sphingolipid hydroxylase (fatty acid hydroxylase superfamily)